MKRPTINEKEAGNGPFFKKDFGTFLSRIFNPHVKGSSIDESLCEEKVFYRDRSMDRLLLKGSNSIKN